MVWTISRGILSSEWKHIQIKGIYYRNVTIIVAGLVIIHESCVHIKLIYLLISLLN